MNLKYDYSLTLSSNIGDENGLSGQEISDGKKRLTAIFAEIERKRAAGELKFLDLPYKTDTISDIQNLAESIRKDWENIVILGIGGSALGNITIFSSLKHPFHNLLPLEKRNAPRFFAADNIDPSSFAALLDTIDIKNTLFNVISKSGSTIETNVAFMVVWNELKKRLGDKASDNVVAITDKEHGILRKICDGEGFKWLPTPDGVEGRFSVLSTVGLFSSYLLGIDIEKILKGAKAMDERCRDTDFNDNPAYMNALIHYLSHKLNGKDISVMLPYSNSLKELADWYCQLWAESLGKAETRGGETVNEGQTPIRALGATDQHSQLQLWREGPNDKIFTVIGVENYSVDVNIPQEFSSIEEISYLGDKSMNQLIQAERTATIASLAINERPVCSITLPKISEHTIGQLLYMYELQTAAAGELYNVNAFNQPGVEEGKLFAFGLMGRPGYGQKAEEISKWKQ